MIKRQLVVDQLRKSLEFRVFYLSPELPNFEETESWFFEQLGVSAERVQAYRQDLLDCEFWKRDLKGRLQLSVPTLRLVDETFKDLTVAQFLSMNSELLVRLREQGPCWYEAQTIATTTELKRQFLGDIQMILQKFIKQSEAVAADTILSWAHISLDVINMNRVEKK